MICIVLVLVWHHIGIGVASYRDWCGIMWGWCGIVWGLVWHRIEWYGIV